jgi:GT2 family glycosyltransferase
MQLSIIILNYNTFRLTCECIASIFVHSQGFSFEVILVDNASSECEADLFLEKFPQITLIKSPQNVGFAKGNNLGIAQAKGAYILLLNSDTKLLENSILKALQRFEQGKNIGALSTALVYPDGRLQPVANRFPFIWAELVELFRLQKLMTKNQRAKLLLGFFFDQQSEVQADWVWGAFFLTKKSIIAQFPDKKLPDDFFMYYEDVQWCYYLKKKLGYQILYFPATKVLHYGSASGLSDTVQKTKSNLKNELIFLLKEKGSYYTYLLYLIRYLKFKTLRSTHFQELASVYAALLKNRLKIE